MRRFVEFVCFWDKETQTANYRLIDCNLVKEISCKNNEYLVITLTDGEIIRAYRDDDVTIAEFYTEVKQSLFPSVMSIMAK